MAQTPQSPNKIGPLTFAPAATSTDTGITALAGGGQTGATLLTAQFNKVSTVASGNDSVALPAIGVTPSKLGAIGSQVIVRNAGSNSLQVFGSGTDTINDVATGTGVAVGSGKTAIFIAHSYSAAGVGNWYMVLSA
jgi:hypothetical protein